MSKMMVTHAYPDPLIRQFIEENARDPVVALNNALAIEAEYRQLFAQQPNDTRITNPYVLLLDVFNHPELWQHPERISEDELAKRGYGIVMPITEKEKQYTPNTLAICHDTIDQFKRNWRLFTENSLENLNWNNVFAAGGAINACLLPIPEKSAKSYRTIREYYHEKQYASSDIDLFIYGLDEEQAKLKMEEIYNSVRDSIPWDVSCIRSKNVVTLVSKYPYRHIQIVLRLYRSPAEVLMGFDVDCCSVGYDGKRVWALPRAREAIIRCQNRVDLTRRSPSYEVRLAKYSGRGFEILVPGLDRERINPTIYERSFEKLYGLARLLVMEELGTPDARYVFLEKRRQHRKRPAHKNAGSYAANHRGSFGDLKGGSFDNSDYETVHLPYGASWNANNIVHRLYTKDMILNSPWYPKNRGRNIKFHRHPCFFGTMQEVMGDCCGHCPDITKLSEDEQPTPNEMDAYVQGVIEFIKDDPGRQAIGSFHPITEGDWSAGAYIDQPQLDLCYAAFNNDLAAAKRIIANAQAEEAASAKESEATTTTAATANVITVATAPACVNTRDSVGRTPLQLAVIGGHVEMATLLIDHGAEICARVADGRTVLHLAAQQGHVPLIKLLLARSQLNEKIKEEREAAAAAAALDETMSDAVSETSSVEMIDKEELSDYPGVINWNSNDDNEDPEVTDPEKIEDDIIDVNIPDWDYKMSAMEHAIFFGHLDAVKVLVEAGADPRRVIKINARRVIYYPLTISMVTKDADTGVEIAKYLISKGARPTQLNSRNEAVAKVAIHYGRLPFVDLFLSSVEEPEQYVNDMDYRHVTSLCKALEQDKRGLVELLLKYGAKPEITLQYCKDRCARSRTSHPSRYVTGGASYEYDSDQAGKNMYDSLKQPIFYTVGNDLYPLLVERGIELNCTINNKKTQEKKTVLDVVCDEISQWESRLEKLRPSPSSSSSTDASKDSKHEEQQEYRKKLLQLYLDQIERCPKDSYERYCWDYAYYTMRQPPNPTVKKELDEAEKKEQEEAIKEIESIISRLQKQRDYLIEHGAKRIVHTHAMDVETAGSLTHNADDQQASAASTDKPKSLEIPQIFNYTILNKTNMHSRVNISKEEEPLYNELFGAVWSNDIATVKRLTTTTTTTTNDDGSDTTRYPLHIVVYNQNAQSLLHIACIRGYATMAALILKIADNQYASVVSKDKKKDRKEKSINNYNLPIYDEGLDSDYPTDSYESSIADDSEDDDEETLNAIRDRDLPLMPGKPLENVVSPYELLTRSSPVYFGSIIPGGWIERAPPSSTTSDDDNDDDKHRPFKTSLISLTPLQVASMRGDIKLVRALFETTKKLKNGFDLNKGMRSDAIQALLESEYSNYVYFNDTRLHSVSLAVMLGHEDIIDLFIEEAAAGSHFSGIDIYRDCEDIDKDTSLSPLDNYLGLNVNGKKKKGWIMQHNRGSHNLHEQPLLRIAISTNNHRSMAYLIGKRSSDALRRFAEKHTNDRRSSVLRSKEDLGLAWNHLLGIGMKDGPTPLQVAVKAEQPEALRYMLEHYRDTYKDNEAALLDIINYGTGNNVAPPIYLAVLQESYKCFDILLEFGADPLVIFHGWNIAHHAAHDDKYKMLNHIASKVSTDQWHQLMLSQAARCNRTPLAIAIAKAHYAAVHTLLELLPDSKALSVFDVDCEFPIHLAVKSQNPFIVGQVINKIQSLDMWSLLAIENGAGTTAYEFSRQLLMSQFYSNDLQPVAEGSGGVTIEKYLDMVRQYDPNDKEKEVRPGNATEVYEVMTYTQSLMASQDKVSRRPMELHELQQLVKLAASDSRRISKLHYYARRYDRQRDSPVASSSFSIFKAIWRAQRDTQSAPLVKPVKFRYCVPDVIAIYG
ncbi:ankyrin repeat-containing domain protein [Syncephalis plumigaleata]|nr:ankyrin repeat-containing domain protein [Syncephalis plumigaleata]